MKIIITFLLSVAITCGPQTDTIKELHFLSGTWKIENKESYETWSVTNSGSLEGSSYSIKEGNKKVSESLTIKSKGNDLIYTATVVDQNHGLPIDFVWNKEVKDRFSFENVNHDFPKKLQYKKLNDTTVFVEVLGENNKGFSYKMLKQYPSKNK